MEVVHKSFGMAPLLGLQPQSFWLLTPFAFHLVAKAYNKKAQNDFDIVKYQTWHIAAFQRSKKLPPFKKYIEPLKNEPEQGINEASIKDSLKAYQNGQSRKSKR